MNVRTPNVDESETLVTIGSPDQELTSADIKRVMTTPRIKTLNLEGSWSNGLDLSPLAICKDVERMDIRYADNFQLSSFPTMNNVKDLRISHLSGDVIIDNCSSFPNLKSFGVYVSPDVYSIKLDGLAPHENLKYVKIKDTGVKSLDLSPLSNLSQLSVLSIESSSIEEIDLTPLKECESLRVINLLFNRKLQGIDFSGFPSGTKDINVYHSGFGTIDLSPLRNLSSLEVLDISSNNLSEIDLSPLKHCPNLHRINLESNPVGIIDLTPLKACTRIRSIDLSKMQLSKIDLSPLKGSRTRDLYLSQNPLRELDLTPLSECVDLKLVNLMFCDKLEVLDVTPILSLDCDVSYHENTTLIADKRFQTDT